MNTEPNTFNLNDLTKRYSNYHKNKILLEIELMRFKNKHKLIDTIMELNEETSFITLQVTCKNQHSIKQFQSCEQEFKREFELKLIKTKTITEHYDNKTRNIQKYTYIHKNDKEFDEEVIQ